MSHGLTSLLIFGLLTAAVFARQNSTAQDAPIDPVPQESEKRQERTIDDATLNLHRWGAVTLFHGLPSDRVNALAEDASGLMWFGTDNGLVRYDGRNVESMPGEASLPSRRILALRLDADGSLWIGTDAGAARWSNKSIEVLEETRGRVVTSIGISPQGEIAMVAASGEVIRYHEQSDSQPGSE
ncbi:MAG: hypothetical protein M3X11_08800, partial [Acidobacteriota bacterium]|nr:hypothetical protein [Acidobacteriota bacterium]